MSPPVRSNLEKGKMTKHEMLERLREVAQGPAGLRIEKNRPVSRYLVTGAFDRHVDADTFIAKAQATGDAVGSD